MPKPGKNHSSVSLSTFCSALILKHPFFIFSVFGLPRQDTIFFHQGFRNSPNLFPAPLSTAVLFNPWYQSLFLWFLPYWVTSVTSEQMSLFLSLKIWWRITQLLGASFSCSNNDDPAFSNFSMPKLPLPVEGLSATSFWVCRLLYFSPSYEVYIYFIF